MTQDIWTFQEDLSRRLLRWSRASLLAGGVMGLAGDDFWRGVASQTGGWALINGAIALIGRRSGRSRRAKLANPLDPAITSQESRKLRRILRINAGLDVLYVAGGIVLAATKGKEDAKWRGHGVGIVSQGLFLFFFDLLMAGRLTENPSGQSAEGAQNAPHRKGKR